MASCLDLRSILAIGLSCAGLGLPAASHADPLAAAPTPEQVLGRALFFDESLSHPAGQACASCHASAVAFSDPDKSSPTSAGVTGLLFGNRNAPTAMYAAFSPRFGRDEEGTPVGGQFLDGRAATLEAQARGPFVNPMEMANPDASAVVAKLRAGPNAGLFASVYGVDALADDATAFDRMAQAIAAFERTPAFAPFSSKYDAWLAGKATLTADELAGLHAFEDPHKGNCAACHPSRPSADGTPPLFTDFTYDNLGVPRNPDNRFYAMPVSFNPDGRDFVDPGLGATTGEPADDGKFKVPTLRNITLTSAYMHNGYFVTLAGLMDFYNSRDVKPVCVDPFTREADAVRLECWPAAELQRNVNRDELGNLGLTRREELQIIAFLGTLTDGWTAAPEPATGTLIAIAALALALSRRTRVSRATLANHCSPNRRPA